MTAMNVISKRTVLNGPADARHLVILTVEAYEGDPMRAYAPALTRAFVVVMDSKNEVQVGQAYSETFESAGGRLEAVETGLQKHTAAVEALKQKGFQEA